MDSNAHTNQHQCNGPVATSSKRTKYNSNVMASAGKRPVADSCPSFPQKKQKPAEAAPQDRDFKPSRYSNHQRLQAQGPTADTAEPQGLIQGGDNSLDQKLNPNHTIRSNQNHQPPHHLRLHLDAGPPGSKVENSLDLGKAVKALQMSCSVRDESSLALPDLQSVSVAGVLGDGCEVVNCEPLSESVVHSSVGNADLGLSQIPLPSPDLDSGISHGLRAVEDVALDGYVAEDRAHLLTAEPSDPPGSSPSLMRSDCSVEGHCLTIPGLGNVVRILKSCQLQLPFSSLCMLLGLLMKVMWWFRFEFVSRN
ncbi:hypothetical protein Nepgr_023004 [Nepenthes gracilis]|uniref:Uncharacterized protein n=1 Tax=Nepenthes gracilis TaxID=150966 RepID=A0AAD3XXB8_NEPGR|nr:hypothetical protein Nepgr_023004 [Nepenthes gracilis]